MNEPSSKEALSSASIIAAESAQLQRSIIYGSIATPIKKPDSDHTHKWAVYVRGAHDEDISTYIKRVIFRLHESFPNPSRSIEKPPFEVSETGWGEFQLNIRIVFQDANQKPLNLTHHLKLYPNGEDPTTAQVKTSRPVISEHYEEIVFDPPTAMMKEILEKEPPQYTNIKNSPRYPELEKLESEELLRIEAAISMVENQLASMEDKSNIPPDSTNPPATSSSTTTTTAITHPITTTNNSTSTSNKNRSRK